MECFSTTSAGIEFAGEKEKGFIARPQLHQNNLRILLAYDEPGKKFLLKYVNRKEGFAATHKLTVIHQKKINLYCFWQAAEFSCLQ